MRRFPHISWGYSGLALVLWVLGACAHDHRVKIDPELYVRESNVGHGLPVRVQVVDRRSHRAIYKKTSGPHLPLAGRPLNQVSIYPGTPVDDPVKEAIQTGLARLGFKPVEGERSYQRVLRVEIRLLRLFYQFENPRLKIPEKNVRLRTALDVIAQSPRQTFKRRYETQMDKSQNLLTGEFKNQQFINNGLSLTLQKMFEDPELLDFLSPKT